MQLSFKKKKKTSYPEEINSVSFFFSFFISLCHSSRCEIRAALIRPAATVSPFVTQDRCMLDMFVFP